MTQDQIVHAWKNPSARAALSALPANPAGAIELSETELTETNGGSTTVCFLIISYLVGSK